jgi:hypothetical protein
MGQPSLLYSLSLVSPSILQISLAAERELNPLSGAAKLLTFNNVHCTEAEFFNVRVLRVFLLAIHSHLYLWILLPPSPS